MNKAIIIVLATITLIGVGAAIWRTQYLKESFAIANFDQCVAAGNPVMESYPAQCKTEDGRMFVEDLPPRLLAQRVCATANIPTDVSLDTFLDRENGSVEVRWRNSVTGEEKMLLLPYDPTNDFPGCSESAKRVMQHMKETDQGIGKNPPTSADKAPEGSIHNMPLPKTVAMVREYAAEKENVLPTEIRIISAYEKEWPNACLGMPGNVPEDEMCAQVIIPGWEVTLQVKGKTLIYRTNGDGSQIRESK